MPDAELKALAEKAGSVAQTLKAMGNDKRLLILCQLAQQGEMNVSTLATAVGLSQSALSQHLARMRAEDMVATRRDSQTIWYRIGDERTRRLMSTLYDIYCVE